MAYCTIPDIEELYGKPFSAAGLVKPATITKWIDQTAAVLNSIIASQNVITPITTPANAVLLLLHYNAVGVLVRIDNATFSQQKPAKSERGTIWQKEFDAALEHLRTRLDEILLVDTSTVSSAFPTQDEISFPITDDQRF